MKKAAVLVCLFGGLALAASLDKSFNVNFSVPSVVAGNELQTGNYKAELKENKLIIKHGRTITEIGVKVETVDRKFGSTAVRYENRDGKYQVEEIQVGGTNMKLVLD